MEPTRPTDPPPARRPWLLLAFIVAVLGVGVVALGMANSWWQRVPAGDFAGQTPPDFPTQVTWLNSDEPLYWERLRGRAVLLTFGYVGCPGCKAMAPHLARWHKDFGPQGLTVITAVPGFLNKLPLVQKWVTEEKIRYPVMYDTNITMTLRYEVASFPSYYLVDRNGVVVWEGSGWEPSLVPVAEEALRKALATR